MPPNLAYPGIKLGGWSLVQGARTAPALTGVPRRDQRLQGNPGPVVGEHHRVRDRCLRTRLIARTQATCQPLQVRGVTLAGWP